jgi:hypothetical protein
MLSNPLQYSQQSLLPQFPGLQAAGLPQMSPGLFGQPGAYNGTAQFGHDSGQAGFAPQSPFGHPQSAFGPQLPFGQQFPFGLSQQFAFGGQAGVPIPVQQIVPVLGQLAQQIAVQSAVAQQIGIAVHQLAHQLALQGLQGYPGGGFGTGQVFAGAGQPYVGGAAQPFGFGGQAGFGGLGPQAQAWGARPQTIQ